MRQLFAIALMMISFDFVFARAQQVSETQNAAVCTQVKNGIIIAFDCDTREIIPFPDCPSFAEQYWELTLKADTRSSYEWYLEILPNCPFAAQARAKIEVLKKQ